MEKKTTPVKKHAEAAQVVRFAMVGVLNTIVDFVVYNLLLFFFVSLAPEVAAVMSGTLAMINSFVFNKNFTFRARKLPTIKLVLFFVVTAIGIYVIRPLVVALFTKFWLWPADVVHGFTNWLHISLSHDFVSHNVALVAAILVVLVYNYLIYKYFIFDEPNK